MIICPTLVPHFTFNEVIRILIIAKGIVHVKCMVNRIKTKISMHLVSLWFLLTKYFESFYLQPLNSKM